MNKLMKKLSSALTALTLCAAAAPVGASGVYNYDVNNDGQVGNADVLIVLNYLRGINDVADVSRLDVDGNHIINKYDYLCITYSMLHVNYSWQYVSF